ncbi:hypothetical protein PSTG_17151 [Puccinia striiformis f. sp. tritici PST-78]|uniref:C2H2-type domain-containing protein n=1 Tax=Puccinia striiformis f. sp. tritici PST-78 TaxID=1165861 RepID=A0A0L0UQM1_9BASI|nr:hypothetical protein PSTG_17151 [Puccinia striiformis f. sp. tritici PST-78]
MSFHHHPSPAPVTAAQASPYGTRVANHAGLAASFWGHFHTDPSAIYSSASSAPIHLPTHSYERSTISHFPAHGLSESFATIDFPSNAPSLWGYQTLLGFTPGSLNQYNPYVASTHVQVEPFISSQSTTPYAEIDQPFDSQFQPGPTLPVTTPAHATTLNQSIPYFHVPSASLLAQNLPYPASEQHSRNSPAFKMFKCTLDPNCQMEFTRAEHLARHERQHKVSVHKEDIEQNTLTEERLVQVHKSMQRQNNIRKAVTMSAQRQDSSERCPSMTESSESTYSPAPSSLSDASLQRPSGASDRRQSQPSPIPSKTPDKILWSQIGTPSSNSYSAHDNNPSALAPPEMFDHSNSSPRVPTIICPVAVSADSHADLGTPFNVSHNHGSTATSDEYHRLTAQYPPRLINYNQISRAPLSSLWPSYQHSATSLSNHPHSPSYASSNNGNEKHLLAHKVTQPVDQGAGHLYKTHDVTLPHHLQFLSTLTHEQALMTTPRKTAGSHGPEDHGFTENLPPCNRHLAAGSNTPDSAPSPTRKRSLSTDEVLDAGSMGQATERNTVKKLRI